MPSERLLRTRHSFTGPQNTSEVKALRGRPECHGVHGGMNGVALLSKAWHLGHLSLGSPQCMVEKAGLLMGY